MTTAQQLGTYRGPAIFSYGFRPFFLGGAVWAGAVMMLFMPMLQGHVTLPTAFSVLDWHIHEFLYGYLPAIVAGFLLTAVPNWTGRLPIRGTPLAVLFAIWLAGRAAVASSALTGPLFTAAVDLFFLIALVAIAGREIVAGKNFRNLGVLGLVALLGAGNVVFHIEAAASGAADYGKRIGVASAILLLALIGGRIVPSFTQNWLARRTPGSSGAFRQVRSFSHRGSGNCPGHLGCCPADRGNSRALRACWHPASHPPSALEGIPHLVRAPGCDPPCGLHLRATGFSPHRARKRIPWRGPAACQASMPGP